jgi:hypothetical protein
LGAFFLKITHLELPLVILKFSLGGAILFLLVAVGKTKRNFSKIARHFFFWSSKTLKSSKNGVNR